MKIGAFCVSTEIQSQRKQADLEKKSYDDLLRERDILSKVRKVMIVEM